MCRSTISFENAIDGLASIGRQTIISSRPRGFSAVAMLRMPAVGFWKNMVPNRAKATSNSPLKRAVCASRATNSALPTPAAAASARATSRKGSQQSVPTAVPPGRMRVGDLQRRLAEAAAHVDHAIARPQVEPIERAAAVCVAHRHEHRAGSA